MEKRPVELVLQDHGKRILHTAYTYLKSTPEAEDILQDTLIQYMNEEKEFESLEHEKAWLLRVAINKCKNQLKSPWYKNRTDFEELKEEGIPEESILLYHAVRALPIKYREVIHLFYYEEASIAWIAKVLDKNESTVRSLLLRARKQLKKSMEVKEDLYESISKSL